MSPPSPKKPPRVTDPLALSPAILLRRVEVSPPFGGVRKEPASSHVLATPGLQAPCPLVSMCSHLSHSCGPKGLGVASPRHHWMQPAGDRPRLKAVFTSWGSQKRLWSKETDGAAGRAGPSACTSFLLGAWSRPSCCAFFCSIASFSRGRSNTTFQQSL